MFTQQTPLDSPFNAFSTAEDVLQGIDLTGKTVIVTGGYSGLGLEAARVLLSAGATVIVPARNREKAHQNLAHLPGILLEEMDLMDPASIDAFAKRFMDEYGTLDILINNAATMAAPLSRDARGYESQFSTNVLGHFQLTCRLWPALVAANGARVVMLSSANHRLVAADLLHDPNFERIPYDPWRAYANSKGANILLALALDHIGQSNGVHAYAVHPGGIFATGLARHMDIGIAKAVGMIDEAGTPIIDPEKGWKTPQQGAGAIVWTATSPLLDGRGGVYCADCNIEPLAADDAESLTMNGASPIVKDPVTAGRLWQLCESLTGARID